MSFLRAISLWLLLGSGIGALAQPTSPLLIEPCRYSDAAAAQVAWLPFPGTVLPSVITRDGAQVLRLGCDFAGTNVERASWDRPLDADLSTAQGIDFQVLCTNVAPISYFSIYFRSGNGWYHGSFFPESTSGWNTIHLNRAEMTVEGEPAGWGRISGIRVSAWKAGNVSTEFLLRDIRKTGVLGVDASIAVLRADSAKTGNGEARRAAALTESMARRLGALGLGATVISDLEVKAGALKPARLIILPYNRSMTERAIVEVRECLASGTKLLSFDSVPGQLQAALTRTNSLLTNSAALGPENTGKELLNLIASLAPEFRKEAAVAAIQKIGVIGGFDSYEAAEANLKGLCEGRETAATALESAATLRGAALRLEAASDYPAALLTAEQSAERLKEAFCLAQRPLAGEFRGFWCHSAFGVQGVSWDQAAQRLAENGFTAVMPNMLWGGATFYPSQVLPQAAGGVSRGDQLAQCVAACHKNGLQVHVWKVNWNLGHAAPKDFVERLRREGRLQASQTGKEQLWLCPSDPRNQRLEIDSMVEVVRNYDVDGLHFDYIRYPDADHCYCAKCRERFARTLGKSVHRWPEDVLNGGPLQSPWLDWRRSNITAVVKAVSEQARILKPKIKISAAVFPNWPTSRDTIGQDWKLWCDRGYLDFVCPMDYTTSNSNFGNMVQNQLDWAGKVPCYPGLGPSATNPRLGSDKVIEQINLTRKARTGGFMVFNYGVEEYQELLPLLGMGITAKR